MRLRRMPVPAADNTCASGRKSPVSRSTPRTLRACSQSCPANRVLRGGGAARRPRGTCRSESFVSCDVAAGDRALRRHRRADR
jgi:hypothetical protein